MDKGFRVIALDGPAHGSSEGIKTNVGDYAKFLIRAQKELGPYKAIIAHSFGAGCSVISTLWGLQVEKLILVAGPARYEVVVKNYLDFIKISPTAQKYFFASLAKKVGLTAQELNVGEIGNKLHVDTLIVHDKGDKEVLFTAALEIKKSLASCQAFRNRRFRPQTHLKRPARDKTSGGFRGFLTTTSA